MKRRDLPKDIENKENFKQIDIAVIENKEFQNDEFYKEAMKELSDKNNSYFPA